jgi:hypothetical protein
MRLLFRASPPGINSGFDGSVMAQAKVAFFATEDSY